MEEAKLKEIENRLRQLFDSADKSTRENAPKALRKSEGIQVIRRRKGRPDRHITRSPRQCTDPA